MESLEKEVENILRKIINKIFGCRIQYCVHFFFQK